MSSFLLFVFLPLLLLIAVVDVLTMSDERRAKVWRRAGLSQSAIAAKLGVSRYRVRQFLAV